jgi:hypothetical protein
LVGRGCDDEGDGECSAAAAAAEVNWSMLDRCTFCREIPDSIEVDVANGEKVPLAMDQFEVVLEERVTSMVPGASEKLYVLKCLRCEGWYSYETYYEGGARPGPPGYDSLVSITRLTKAEAMELLK